MGLAGKYDIPKDICVGDFIAADLSYYFEETKRNRIRINYTVFEVKAIQITSGYIVYQGEGFNAELDLARPETHGRIFRCPLTPRFRRGDEVDYIEYGDGLDFKKWQAKVKDIFYQVVAGVGDIEPIYDISRVDPDDPVTPYRGARVRESSLEPATDTTAGTIYPAVSYSLKGERIRHIHVYEVARKYEGNIATNFTNEVKQLAGEAMERGELTEVEVDQNHLVIEVFNGPRPL